MKKQIGLIYSLHNANPIDLIDQLRQRATFVDVDWDSMTPEQRKLYNDDKFYAADKLQRASNYLRGQGL